MSIFIFIEYIKKHSRQTLYFYLINLGIIFTWLISNVYSAGASSWLVEKALPIIAYLSLGLTFIKLIQTLIWHNKIYKAMKKKTPLEVFVAYILFGIPFFWCLRTKRTIVGASHSPKEIFFGIYHT